MLKTAAPTTSPPSPFFVDAADPADYAALGRAFEAVIKATDPPDLSLLSADDRARSAGRERTSSTRDGDRPSEQTAELSLLSRRGAGDVLDTSTSGPARCTPPMRRSTGWCRRRSHILVPSASWPHPRRRSMGPMPVTTRGAGTSCAGNAVGPLVIDTSRYLNKIISIDPAARSAVVEPGVVQALLSRCRDRTGCASARDSSNQHPLHDRRDDREQRVRAARPRRAAPTTSSPST